MTFSTAIEEFLVYLVIERNASQRTLPEYRRDVMRLATFAEDEKKKLREYIPNIWEDKNA